MLDSSIEWVGQVLYSLSAPTNSTANSIGKNIVYTTLKVNNEVKKNDKIKISIQ